MTHWARLLGNLASVFVIAGCSGQEPRLAAPELDPSTAVQQALTLYDFNKDGAIADQELDAVPGLKHSVAHLDTDADNRLSSQEIEARFTRYLEDKIAINTVVCQVLLNGRPLEGAQVALKPETFMGPSIKPAQGTTDAEGFCTLQTAGEEFPGVHCGIFRVEVTRPAGGALPARYNSATMLGCDIGPGSSVLENGLILRLTGS